MESNPQKESIKKKINSERNRLIQVSRFIHSHPEPNFEEWESSKFLVRTLEELGFKVEFPFSNVATSFRATIRGNAAGPHVVILAEFDALRVTMQDGTSPVVHACAHNLNCSAAIGALIALNSLINELPGSVSIVGTPAEEGGGGKIILLNNGSFNDADVVMTVHGDQRDWYTVARACTAGESLRITFLGHSQSKGYSKNYVNALDAVVIFMNALSILDYRLTPDSLIQRKLVADARAVNTIPLEMKVEIQIRSGDETFLDDMREEVIAAARGAAQSIGAEVKIEPKGLRYERIIENKTLEQVAKTNIEYLGHKFTEDEPSPYPFGTDTGNISHRVPTLQFLIGRPEGFKFHTPVAVEQSITDSAHEMMIESSKILALTTLDLLTNPRVVDSAKMELERYRKSGFEGLYSWHQKI